MLDELDLDGSEAEHRQPEDHRIIEDDLVLPEGVIHRVDPLCVLCAAISTATRNSSHQTSRYTRPVRARRTC